ncbi:hypothetical protein SDC9_164812 [bioreactor metagenome]|uniref:Uncharacterized protein n=1 Tax=bioreactor metagenome TaxID=1076179 RepID=A0A645FV94_9ZZZZ
MDIENTNTIFYRLVKPEGKVSVSGTGTTIGIYYRLLKLGVHCNI